MNGLASLYATTGDSVFTTQGLLIYLVALWGINHKPWKGSVGKHTIKVTNPN